MLKSFSLTIVFLSGILFVQAQNPFISSYDEVEAIFTEKAEIIATCPGGGVWEIEFNEYRMLAIVDLEFDRFRLMSPLHVKEKDLRKSDYKKILEAQFESLLDVKYAIRQGELWAVYTHPYSNMTETLLWDAIKQTYYSRDNYGGTYQSTNLIFGSTK